MMEKTEMERKEQKSTTILLTQARPEGQGGG
jgi:hypothetical protein